MPGMSTQQITPERSGYPDAAKTQGLQLGRGVCAFGGRAHAQLPGPETHPT